MWVVDASPQLTPLAGACRPHSSVRSYPDEVELVRVPGFLGQRVSVVQDPCNEGRSHMVRASGSHTNTVLHTEVEFKHDLGTPAAEPQVH